MNLAFQIAARTALILYGSAILGSLLVWAFLDVKLWVPTETNSLREALLFTFHILGLGGLAAALVKW